MIYFGTSIGIAVRGNDLEVVCARGRGRRVAVTGFLRLEEYRRRPVEQVAEQYRRFRKANHALASSATVVLARESGLLRLLEIPGEVGENLPQAVGYQVDTLHPFEEGGVYYDYSLLPAPAPGDEALAASETAAKPLRVAVALAEKQFIDDFYEWCCRAGIDVCGFTFSTAVLYQALGCRATPLVVLDRGPQSTEILGLSSDGAFYSRQFPAGQPPDREVELCAAELRWGSEQPRPLVQIGRPCEGAAAESPGVSLEEHLAGALPAIAVAQPSGSAPAVTSDAAPFDLSQSFTAYAAALAGLERTLPLTPPKPGLRWNLLPVEKRVYRSHWAYAVAYAQAAAIVALAVAWPLTGWVQDRFYSARLDATIRTVKPRVQYAEKLDARQQRILSKLQLLRSQQQDIARKMEALQELTALIPPAVWLNLLTLNGNQLFVIGQAESTSGLLQVLSQSSNFEQPQFTASATRGADGRETFQVRMLLRETPLRPVPAPPLRALAPPPMPPAGPVAPPAPAAAEAGNAASTPPKGGK